MHQFIKNIITLSLRNKIFVLFLTGILLIAGIIAYMHTPIEAYPDVTNTRVRIISQWPGRSAEELEKFVSLPIMREVNNIPRKTDVRSVSLFGLSVVTVIFDDDVDDFYAQQMAVNKMQSIDLPEGVESEIEPPSGATGEIFRYVIEGNLPIKELTAINEWVVEKELLSVPGVANITSFGGEEKIYEIQVDPTELLAYDVTPLELFEAVENSNINIGGDILKKGNQAFAIRGVGLLKSIEDIEHIMIKNDNGTPICIKDVAKVSISAKPRLGQVGLNDKDDIIQGIVVMLRGENPSIVIESIKEKITELNEHILPHGVTVTPFLDRTKLVNSTVHTVLKNLIGGVLLVSLVVFIFLYNWRTTFIVASVIPLAFLFAILMLRIQGLPANLISMGALDFGLLLEGTLVIVESIFVGLEKNSLLYGDKYEHLLKGGVIRKYTNKVAPHIFFAQLILVVALLPIFSFQKVEGKMFSPLAFTLGYALLGALILSLTYVPVMANILLKKPVKTRLNWVSKHLIDGIYHIFSFCSKHRLATIGSFIILLTLCCIRFSMWGTEFIPSMNEGAIYIRATLPNSINLDEAVRLTKQMKEDIRSFEEVDFVLTQTGRPNDGTDATGFFNIEFHTELLPDKQRKSKRTNAELIEEISEKLSKYPGIDLGFSQPIQDNVEEYVAGVKSSLVIKIFGKDLYELEELAGQTAEAIKKVKGIEDVNVFNSIGLPELRIDINDKKLAQYGISMADAQATVQLALAGKTATTFYEDDRIFDVMIRFDEPSRDHEDKIANILIPTASGHKVALSDIADISFITSPTFIYREGNSRYISVGFSIRDRDLGSTIAEAKKVVKEEVSIPTKNRVEWAGEFESQQRATQRLAVIVPAALLMVLLLLYFNFHNVKDTLIAASAIPYALIGGFLSLWATNTIFGISAGIGFIILFGIVSIDSILLVSIMKNEMMRHHNLRIAIDNAVKQRIRPVLMIAFMGSMGLLPAALSTGMGSEIQKPLAIMIVGGIIVCMLLSFTVLPQVFYFAYRRDKLNQTKLKS